MIFVLIGCGIVIIALLAAIIDLLNDLKIVTEMYNNLMSSHDQVIDKWTETIDKWDTTFKLYEEADELNQELRNDISNFEQRISSLEKIYALYVTSKDEDAQKICPVTKAPCSECMPGGPCAVEEEESH